MLFLLLQRAAAARIRGELGLEIAERALRLTDAELGREVHRLALHGERHAAERAGHAEEGEGRLVGSDVNYEVVLELKTPRGQVVKKNAVYAVTTRPLLMVMRQDSL